MGSSQVSQGQGTSSSSRGGMIGLFLGGFVLGLLLGVPLTLKIFKYENHTEKQATVAEVSPSVAPSPESHGESLSVKEEHASSEEPEKEVLISAQMRDRLMRLDFLNLLQDAEIHRFRFEGETKGIRITKIRSGSFYEKIGIKDGDIIEQINGIAFADLSTSKKNIAEQLPGAKEAVLKIRRGERLITVRIKVVKDLVE